MTDGDPIDTASSPAGRSSASFAHRLVPKAGVRAQLVLAATVWLVGASILLVRGTGYVYGRSWHAWALGGALIIAALKSRYMLDGVASRAVARIRGRGRAGVFGFFSVRAYLLVAVMMGGGIALRGAVVDPDAVGAGVLGAVYLGIGIALVIADRIFWRAAIAADHDEGDRPGGRGRS
jgi:hypothetical protein